MANLKRDGRGAWPPSYRRPKTGTFASGKSEGEVIITKFDRGDLLAAWEAKTQEGLSLSHLGRDFGFREASHPDITITANTSKLQRQNLLNGDLGATLATSSLGCRNLPEIRCRKKSPGTLSLYSTRTSVKYHFKQREILPAASISQAFPAPVRLRP